MPKCVVMKQSFNAPVDLIFHIFSKHRTFNTVLWPLQSVVIKAAEDDQNTDGVGSIRKMGIELFKPIQEVITQSLPNQMIEYQMLKNGFFTYHLGRLEFNESQGRTYLTYTIWLESKVPLLTEMTLMQLKLSATRGLKKIAVKINQFQMKAL
ncbi:SRPBCC family protein [Acinetobacter colistiniresistens]|uniref:SRPBCC family protein n=1 Tax=Acinetobacter colistiniresistens TaxID=280145 RepID=A0A558FL90_9GAMM|nr:SRPBCC family protein [Acinetobacter colistiniresistens]TVT86281.1 SRPBCC family protein [Acinetobacter colistiniresistens]